MSGTMYSVPGGVLPDLPAPESRALSYRIALSILHHGYSRRIRPGRFGSVLDCRRSADDFAQHRLEPAPVQGNKNLVTVVSSVCTDLSVGRMRTFTKSLVGPWEFPLPREQWRDAPGMSARMNPVQQSRSHGIINTDHVRGAAITYGIASLTGFAEDYA
jgi:hypothetical protein